MSGGKEMTAVRRAGAESDTAGASGPPALSIEQVWKVYPQRSLLRRASKQENRPALRDVSFAVRQGEMVGLLGPNGAGKTTLLKIISTLLYPSSGRVRIYGHDIFRDSLAIRGMMGLVTCDERSFYWRLTGRQNLSFFATLYGLSRKETAVRMEELFETLGLTEAADRSYDGYSSGMKQKLAIARGLLTRPRIVLYDEPTRSLDPLSAYNIRRWILEDRARSPRQTHLIATNQLREAEQLCDRVLIINRGAVIAQGTIPQIREMWQKGDYGIHRVTCRGFAPSRPLRPAPETGLLDIEAENGAEPGTVTLRLRIRNGSEGLSLALAAILESGGKVIECKSEQVPFDEVFCSLVLGERAP